MATFEMPLVCILGCAIFILLLVSNLNDYVVFKKENNATFTPFPTSDLIDAVANVTGEFTLDTGHKKKFTAMPCHLVTIDTGDAAFICNVDASTDYFGIKTVKRAGLWLLAVHNAMGIEYTFGRQYYGSKTFHSLQLKYVSALDLKKKTACISCENKSDLEHMLRFLLTPASPQVASGVPPVYPS
ncbi:MAG: hypothetical protein ABJA67_15295 [Chthonomonadales bacterium]